MRRKIISIIVLICMAFSSLVLTTGCSDKNTITVGVAIYQYTDNFMALYRDQLIFDFENLNRENEKKGIKTRYKLVMTNGNNDPVEQANQINTLIAMNVNLIIFNPVLTSSCDALLYKIHAAGIPCVVINREPLGKEGPESYESIIYYENVAYVGCKAAQSGEMQGEIIYNLDDHGDINKDGKLDYLLLKGDPENPDAQDRTNYSVGSCENGEYNREHAKYVKLCKDNGVNITTHAVMDDQLANWDQAKAEELTTNALNITSNQIEVIFCNNDAMALGAHTAVKKRGLTVGKDIYIVGVDGLQSVLTMVDKGEITGTVKNSHINQSKKTISVALHFLNGGTKQDFPHEEGKSRESELKGYYWIDYIKYDQLSRQLGDLDG